MFLVATPVVANTEEVTFEATMAPRREVTEYAAELASGTLVSVGIGERREMSRLPLTSATSRRARGRAGCRGTTATRGAAVGRMSRRVDDDWSSTSRLDALLSVHEAGVKVTWRLITHKYRRSQQSSREVKPKFIDSTQGEPKNIYKP
jgi:hypothetical protein